FGVLDAAAIARVRDEERPAPRDADELHDTLQTAGFLTAAEAAALDSTMFAQLTTARRAACTARGWWICAERLPELRALHPDTTWEPEFVPPASRAGRIWSRGDALVELLRGRLATLGPVTASQLAASMDVACEDVDAALLALEADGAVLRGRFERDPAIGAETQWCDRRLLARIHRYTLNRLRAEIEPVSPADFMRFLFAWQHVSPSHRLVGADGLREVVDQLNGFEAPAGAWERAILPARVEPYESPLLDTLCLTGEVSWARTSPPPSDVAGVVAATPIALFPRAHAALGAKIDARGGGDGG